MKVEQIYNTENTKYELEFRIIKASNLHRNSSKFLLPLHIKSQNYEGKQIISTSGKKYILELPIAPKEWVDLNRYQTTRIRILYEPELSEKLKTAIVKQELDPFQRRSFIDDTLLLGKYQVGGIEYFLQSLDVFWHETNYFVMKKICDNLKLVGHMIYTEAESSQELYSKYKQICVGFLRMCSKNVPWLTNPDIPYRFYNDMDQLYQILVVENLIYFEEDVLIPYFFGKLLQNANAIVRSFWFFFWN